MSGDGYLIDDPNDIHVVVEGETPTPSARRGPAPSVEHEQRFAQAHLQQRQRQAQEVDNAILTLDSQGKALEERYATHAENGDYTKQAQIQREMQRLEQQRVQLEGRAADLRRSVDPFEDYLSGFSPRDAQWLREHRDYVVDPQKSAKVQGAHHFALGEGHALGSDEYYNYVNRLLGTGGNSGGNGTASGSGSSRSSGGGDGRTVSLSKGEIERSEDGSITWNPGDKTPSGEVINRGDPRVGKPIGRAAYGFRKLQMQKQGYYNRQG
jgi:hypothetical protein